jgi:hypothetical protein
VEEDKTGGGGVGVGDMQEALEALLKHGAKPKGKAFMPGKEQVDRLFVFDELLCPEVAKRYLHLPRQDMLCYIPAHKLIFPKFFAPKGTGLPSIERVSDPAVALWGVTLDITGQDISRLEFYKGAPNRCHLRSVVVCDRGGRKYPARTYVVSVPDEEMSKPSKEFRSIIVEGARTRCLPEEHVSMLEALETLD